jgi:hypothetical protein
MAGILCEAGMCPLGVLTRHGDSVGDAMMDVAVLE